MKRRQASSSASRLLRSGSAERGARALRGWSEAPHRTEAERHRAAAVCARLQGESAVAVAGLHGVATGTVHRWVAAWRSAGPAGLAQARSPGRPRVQEAADDVVAAVLATAGPRVTGPDFSTRAIAQLTGLSQPIVARSVRRILGAARPADPTAGSMRRGSAESAVGASPSAPGVASAERAEGGTPLEVPAGEPDTGWRLSAVTVVHPGIVIEAERTGVPRRGSRRAADRRAAALLSALRVSGAQGWTGSAAGVPESGSGGRLVRWDPEAGEWEDFLGEVDGLLGELVVDEQGIPGALLAALAARAGRGLHGLHWRRGETQETHAPSDSEQVVLTEAALRQAALDRSSWLPTAPLSSTEQLAIALRQEIMAADARAGDRLDPGRLAAHLGFAPSAVRSALRRLADDGLLGGEEGAWRVPVVTGADVVDLYAARLQLGGVIVRACARQPRHALLPVRLALRQVEAAADQGTAADVHQADLRFQHDLAEASGLRQSARSFHALTLRVHLFISVLRLDYTPAVDRIVSDDHRLLAALLAGDEDRAASIWRGKLDNAVRHMSGQAPESFDAGLWQRLTR